MNDNKAKKLGTEPYKGVRDFYPDDMSVQNAIFNIWKNTVKKYGYVEYGASVLEPSELYKAKTGDEIVNEQTYTFIDRGEREVTLRPEMTPTLARMISARRRDIVFPARWFSIPNLFRYEQPQRGRVREHWQLNVDIFGVDSSVAEVEIINIAYDITRAYGLKDSDFEIRINNRKIVNYILKDIFALDDDTAHHVAKLIDKKAKLDAELFKISLIDILRPKIGNVGEFEKKFDLFVTMLNSKNFAEFSNCLPQDKLEHEGLSEIKNIIKDLESLGITNVRFDQTLMRGFDYYTGTVFEIFDLSPENRRSVFGGGRYDELTTLFGGDRISAVGFGAGDLIARNLMETYGNLPKSESPADIAIVVMGEQHYPYSFDLAQKLRAKNFRVEIDLSGKRVGDQISNADKKGIPKVIVVGENEVRTGELKIKNLASGEEHSVKDLNIN